MPLYIKTQAIFKYFSHFRKILMKIVIAYGIMSYEH
jgi:hypothetical protein